MRMLFTSLSQPGPKPALAVYPDASPSIDCNAMRVSTPSDSKLFMESRTGFYGLLCGVFLLRVALIALIPLDLAGDEAYYWEWGQHLALGYYSKPPGIGWLMAGITALFGPHEWAIHGTAALLGTLASLCLYELGRQLFTPRVAALGTLLFLLSPGAILLNWLLTIDAPLTAAWAAALLLFWLAFERQYKSPLANLGLTIALVAGVLVKQMMLVFYPLALIFLATAKERRPMLRSPSLWGIFAASLLALVPPILWNAQREWITVAHTSGHFQADEFSPLQACLRFLTFFATILGVTAPLTGALMILRLAVIPSQWRASSPAIQYLWIFSAPALGVIALMSFRQEINPNWPAVFYLAPALLVAQWGAVNASKRWLGRALKWSAGISITLYVLLGVAGSGWVRVPDFEPSGRLRGWSTVAARIQKTREETAGAQGWMIITQGHRFLTSELAFYLPDHPRVYPYRPDYGRVRSQHDFWDDPGERLGDDALIVVDRNREITPELRDRFETVTLLDSLVFPEIREKQRYYKVYVGRNLRSWPENPHRR